MAARRTYTYTRSEVNDVDVTMVELSLTSKDPKLADALETNNERDPIRTESVGDDEAAKASAISDSSVVSTNALSSKERGSTLTVYNVPENQNEESMKQLVQELLGPRVNIERCKLHSDKSFLLTNVVDVILSESQVIEINFHRWIEASWCQSLQGVTKSQLSDLWLDTNRQPVDTKYLECPRHKFKVNKISLGSFSTPGSYTSHWERTEHRGKFKAFTVVFEHDTKKVSVKWADSRNTVNIMETNFDNLDKCLLVCPYSPSAFKIFLFLNTPVKLLRRRFAEQGKKNHIIQLIEQRDQVIVNQNTRGNCFSLRRQIQLDNCTKEIIGSSNVLLLELADKEFFYQEFLLKLQKQKFLVLASNPQIKKYDDAICKLASPQFESFDTSYAWFCLTSQGFKITDQITKDFLQLVSKHKHEKLLTEIFHKISRFAESHNICPLRTTFERESMSLHTENRSASEDHDEMPQHYARIRRVILTPTTVRGLRGEWTGQNRVVRHFDRDRFIRVSIRDDDCQQLNVGFIDHAVQRVTKFLSEGLRIADRHYKFLGASNSQLKDHGVWMYASDGVNTAESIRAWMGDLSMERCVATYMARLGQFFTTSKETIDVEVECIPDITRDSYIFTDGIGKISAPLAKKISSKLKNEIVPSAFQIRLGGCKGVVAVAPDLGDREIVQIRPSMEKFKSNHKKLEVMQITKADPLYLNRQVIILMDGLGVPKSGFFSLQEAMLQRMASMLLKEDDAATAISKIKMEVTCSELLQSEIVLTLEPFFRSILGAIYLQKLNELMKRTRIEIPPENGRIMMGTVDETSSLKYGEVFVKYSSRVDITSRDQPIILEGSVVVAKNPCFHPGDMRKLRAVNCPQLSHMIDCIVFPSKGIRPHPNQMSGSDLDGDMYFVCWEESLLPMVQNRKPMDYVAQKKKLEDSKITENDMIQFIGTYLQSDQLGIIANAHLVHADAQKKGIFSSPCLTLAQMHSDAVDFPKTGQCVTVPQDLRPLKYPYFMQKRDKPGYTSNGVIAKLFDQCHAISKFSQKNQVQQINVDDDFELPGYEVFLEDALALKITYCEQMQTIMEMFGIETEAEILTGQILNVAKRCGISQKNHQEAGEIIRGRVKHMKKNLIKKFYEAFGGRNCEPTREVLQKASAVYHVTYSSQAKVRQKNQMLGLPWMFSDLLVAVKAEKCKEPDCMQIRCTKPTSLLNKLSTDIESFQCWLNSCKIPSMSSDLYHRLRDIMIHNGIEADLVMFGSTVTKITSSSSLVDYLILGSDQQAVTDDMFSNVISMLSAACPLNMAGSSNVSVTGQKAVFMSLKVCLFQDTICLQRTAFIVAALIKNKWMIPAIKLIVAWASNEMNTSMFGNKNDCLLSLEDLVLMFFTVAFDVLRCGCSVLPSDTQATLKLLKDNHFILCSIDKCQHLCTLGEKPKTDQEQATNIDANKATGTEIGELILKFFMYYSSNKNSTLQPSVGQYESNLLWSIKGTTLLSLKDEQCLQISDRMMQAYHSLAHSTSMEEFLNSRPIEDDHIVEDLPNQVCAFIAFSFEFHADRIKKKSGAQSVTIRSKTFTNSSAGFVLEAWGDSMSLFIVKQLIRDLIKTSMMMTQGGDVAPRITAKDAHHVLFEACPDRTALVRLQRYHGPCQVRHDKRRLSKHVPRLYMRDPTSDYDFIKFKTAFKKQINFIRQNYDGNFGDLTGGISYGTYYVANAEGKGTELQSGLSEYDFVEWVNSQGLHTSERLVGTYHSRNAPKEAQSGREEFQSRREEPESGWDQSQREWDEQQKGLQDPVRGWSQMDWLESQRECGEPKNGERQPQRELRVGEVEPQKGWGDPQWEWEQSQKESGEPIRKWKETRRIWSLEETKRGQEGPQQGEGESQRGKGESQREQGRPQQEQGASQVGKAESLRKQGESQREQGEPQTRQGEPQTEQGESQRGQRESQCGQDVSKKEYGTSQLERTVYKAGRGAHYERAELFQRRYKPNHHSPKISTAFYPDGKTNLDKLNTFLSSRGFSMADEVNEYRVTINLKLLSAGEASIDGILVLNENFKFARLQPPTTKWLFLDTVRGHLEREHEIVPKALDMRFKIISRSGTSNLDVLRKFNCEDLLLNASKILKRGSNGVVIGVNEKYKEQVQFLREKRVTIFEHRDKTSNSRSNEDCFLKRIKIRLNKGKEFSRSKRDREFTSIDENRVEVTIWTLLPDLGNQKLCEDFISWIWKFGRELGDVLV